MKRCRRAVLSVGLVACVAAATGCQNSKSVGSPLSARASAMQAAHDRRLSPAARNMEARRKRHLPAGQAAAAKQVSAATTQH